MVEVKQMELVVIGGGLSGVCAAVASARKGLKTALVHDRPVPGGNCSSEIGVNMNGGAQNGHSPSVYAREGGIVEEFKMNYRYYNKDRDLAFFSLINNQENLEVYLNTYITDVECDEGAIRSVSGVQLGSERTFKFEAPMFVDCTGDGSIAFKAGAEYMYGREAQSEFGESLAPVEADDYTMGDTILFFARDAGKEVTFHRPDWAYDITKCSFFKNLGDDKGLDRSFYSVGGGPFCGYWWIEFGGQLDIVYDNEDIALELRKICYGVWDYMKNSGKFPQLSTYELEKVSTLPGKRESRRIIGDVILTQSDVDNKTEFPDAVATAGWEMDVHAPKGIYDDDRATYWHFVGGTFGLPFGMMYAKDVKNLMLAGRNMSASHVAFGATRLACQGGAAGQVCGTAAYLCQKYDCTPRDIREHHIEELQQILLQDDQYILGKTEPGNNSLYEDVTITASSEKEYSNQQADDMLCLNHTYAIVLPSTTGRIDSFQIKIKNTSDEEQLLKLKVMGGTRKENYIPEYIIHEPEVVVPADYNDWLELSVQADDLQDDKAYIMFEQNPNLRLYSNDTLLTGAVSFLVEPQVETTSKFQGLYRFWRLRKDKPSRSIAFRDVKPEQNIFSPVNVLNRVSRPYGTPNLWISQSNQAEWIALHYDVPKSVGTMELVFNTMLEEDNMPDILPQMVKKYDVEIETADGEIFYIPDVENHQRVAKHDIHLENVVEIKINFKENYGSEYFELYGIRFPVKEA